MATSSPRKDNEGANEVFDASKHAKTPTHLLASPPAPLPAVRIRLVSPAIGYGLFAARDFAPDEFVFHEAPLMTARFNERFSADVSLMAGQVAACRAILLGHGCGNGHGNGSGNGNGSGCRDGGRGNGGDGGMDAGLVAAVAFPALAARLGIKPVSFERAAQVLGRGTQGENGEGEKEGEMLGMGMNLVKGHGKYAGSDVTREEYEAYTSSLKVSATPTETEAREACLDFFKHYAFQVYGPGKGTSGGGGGGNSTLVATTRDACIYLLASLINHCCTPPYSSFMGSNSSGNKNRSKRGPNCSWRIGPSGLAQFIKPRHICVQARRAIREGEQLTWDYGKREKGFVCECETCRDSLMGGLGSMCGVL